jgi:hypothetical protein
MQKFPYTLPDGVCAKLRQHQSSGLLEETCLPKIP